jgi:hypothetical protein
MAKRPSHLNSPPLSRARQGTAAALEDEAQRIAANPSTSVPSPGLPLCMPRTRWLAWYIVISMSKLDDYRAKAEYCRKMATKVMGPLDKEDGGNRPLTGGR